MKAFDSDAVSVVANLAKLPQGEQEMVMGAINVEEFEVIEGLDRPSDYSIIMDRFYSYIKREKPYFKERIDVRDFFEFSSWSLNSRLNGSGRSPVLSSFPHPTSGSKRMKF